MAPQELRLLHNYRQVFSIELLLYALFSLRHEPQSSVLFRSGKTEENLRFSSLNLGLDLSFNYPSSQCASGFCGHQ